MKLELTQRQCRNLAFFIQMNFIDSIRKDEDIDNINYLSDICKAYETIKEAGENKDAE